MADDVQRTRTSLRLRKQVKINCLRDTTIPDHGDFIQVLCKIGHMEVNPEMWCSTEVLYVENYSSTVSVGYGVILYPASDGCDKEVYEVQFLP